MIPNLLLVPRPMLIIDPKGENAKITHEARSKFGPVHVLDPFGITGLPSAAYNPLARLAPDSLDLGEDAQATLVETHADAESALRAILAEPPDVVVTDVRLPGIDGLGLFSAVQEADPELPVILITGHGDITMAVRAMRGGAYDFLAKPFSREELVERIHLLLDERAMQFAMTPPGAAGGF